jgi:ribonuclease HI
MKKYIAYVDGGSRGNPGTAGYGVAITDENGDSVVNLSVFLGIRTNNFAEYSGLLGALNYAVSHGYRDLQIYADSELMVKQISGAYKVKSADLKPLFDQAREMISRLHSFRITHIPREKNREADRLANLAMDQSVDSSSPKELFTS